MTHSSATPVDGPSAVAALRSGVESHRPADDAGGTATRASASTSPKSATEVDPVSRASFDTSLDAMIDESAHDEVAEQLIGQTALLSLHFMSQELMRLRAQTEERFRELRQDEG